MNSLAATMRNGKEGVAYRLVFLQGNTAVKTVNFVDGSASDSTPFTTEGIYTIALVASNIVLQQYASVNIGEPTPNAPTISGVTPFADTSTVTIVAEEGTTIKYTTDGSTPSASNGQTYSSPFTISQSVLVQAVAILGTKTSAVANKSFVKEEPQQGFFTSVKNGSTDYAKDSSQTTYEGANLTVAYNASAEPTVTTVALKDGAFITSRTSLTGSPITVPCSSTGQFQLVALDASDNVVETWCTIHVSE